MRSFGVRIRSKREPESGRSVGKAEFCGFIRWYPLEMRPSGRHAWAGLVVFGFFIYKLQEFCDGAIGRVTIGATRERGLPARSRLA